MCNTAEERAALKQEVVKRIKSMGLSGEQFRKRFNVPKNYLSALGNPYATYGGVPDRAIEWFQTFVMLGEDTPKYEKLDPGERHTAAKQKPVIPVEGPIFPTMDEPYMHHIHDEYLKNYIPLVAECDDLKPTIEPISTKKPSEKLCPKCGAKEHRDEAMFCYACGTALKTQAEFVIASLESIRTKIGILPSATKDEVRDILIMAVDYIKNISEV